MIERRILLVENDITFCHAIEEHMKNRDTDVIWINSPIVALEQFMKHEYCIVITDYQLPEMACLEMIRIMRAAKSTPILVLTNRLELSERIALFYAGANAYIEKPINVKECVAQSTSLMQLYCAAKCEPKEYSPITFGTELIINPLYRQVIIDGVPIKLTRTEFDLFLYMARYPGQVWSRSQIYHQVWADDFGLTGDNIVRAHIGNLRKKLNNVGKDYIQNSRGIGYKFVPPASE